MPGYVTLQIRVKDEERRRLKALAARLGTTYQDLLAKQVRTLIKEEKQFIQREKPAVQIASCAPSPDQVEGRIAEIRENAIATGEDPDRMIRFVLEEWGYDPAAFPSLYSPVT